ncbi:TetR/AcrR family transcriptional regulator [Burkholderia sp. MR1-5-21]
MRPPLPAGEQVVQVKKAEVKEAILAAAFDLFCRKGYTSTTMSEIARASGTTVANLYVYFDSKLLILYAIYQPWLDDQLRVLRESVFKLRTPRTRLRRLITGLWGDIPAADHCFANSLIDALSGAPQGMEKPSALLATVEGALSSLLGEILPPARAELAKDQLLAHVLWMAFDGFVVNQRIGDVRDVGRIADLMTDLLLGDSGESGK